MLVSPNTSDANALSRANRRKSISMLAAKAGLGDHEQFALSPDGTGTVRSLDLPSGSGGFKKIPLTKRGSFLKKFKADSFFNLIKNPTKPEGGGKGGSPRARSVF